jgi:Tfp pilus assembly protein PilF
MWAHYAKGFAYYMLGQDNLAEDSYRKVIAPTETDLSSDERAHAKFGYGLIYVRKKSVGQDYFKQGMTYLKEACNSGRCKIACQALEQGLSIDPNTILSFDRQK